MVLETIVSPRYARENSWTIAALGAIFVSLAVAIVHWFGLGPQSSLLMMVFVIIPAVPFLTDLIQFQEAETKRMATRRFFGSRTLARHAPMIAVLFSFFIGVTAAFTFWYAALPDATTKLLFESQINELVAIKGSFSGYAVAAQAVEAQLLVAFETIFLHNLEVLMLILAFSILYGAGAIFVLVWNASVIGVFLGKIARSGNIGLGVAGIVPHGVFELLAYTTAALAGGILSRVIVLRRLQAIEEHQTIYDVAKLTGWAIVFLALGAFIESTGVIK